MRATICEILNGNKLLLQLKSTGKFGEGKWNGPGGKLKQDETPVEGVKREVFEETGLTILDPEHLGSIDFYFGEKPKPDWTTYVFRVTKYTGEPRDSDEGILRWFRVGKIPYKKMWADDEYWLPPLLEGKRVKGTFWYNEEGTELVRHELSVG